MIGIVLRPTDDDGSVARGDEVVTTDSLLDIDRTVEQPEARPLAEQPIFSEPVAVVEEATRGVWEVVVIRNGEDEEIHAFEEDADSSRKVTRKLDSSE